MRVDSVYCGPKIKMGAREKEMGVDSLYCWPKKKWVLGKNKWESTLFTVGQKKWVLGKNK